MSKILLVGPDEKRTLIKLGLEASDIPDLPAEKITSNEFSPGRLPTKGIDFEKLSPTLVEYLLEMAERELKLVQELSNGALQEVRASEYHGSANVEVR